MGSRNSATMPADGQALGPVQRPRNFVAAVIHDFDSFQKAVEGVVAIGIDRASLGMLYGNRGAQAIAGRERHWWSALLSDEATYVERYLEEIQSGGHVIGIPLPDADERTREAVRATLRAHGARYIVSSTRWTHVVED